MNTDVRKYRAFTLVEIVIVTTIISILSSVAFLSYTKYNIEARDAIRMSHIQDINRVMSLYKQETWTYPSATNAVDITYSWSRVWSQWEFWGKTLAQIGKIFGDIQDPLYKNKYTYSVTHNGWEYQIGALFENNLKIQDVLSYNTFLPEVLPQSYASSTFDPAIFNPIIWLSSDDINGDGDTGNNPSDGASVASWINKWTLGAIWDPTITGEVTYENAILNGFNSIVVDQNAWILLNNSEITRGEIYYVLNKTNKAVGSGLRSVQTWYHIGPWHNCVDSISINKSPEFYTNLSGGKKDPYFYSFYTDDNNYTFRTNGNNLGFSWPTNSIAGITWAFNAAWHDVESKSKKKWQNCSSAWSSSADIAIWEVLIFDSDVYTLTEDDRLKIEWYLAWKWWLENKLPWAHPYKNTPPEWPTDPGEVEVITPDSGVYVSWDYNGLITHTSTGSTHYVLAAPSLITYDTSDTDLQSIISNRKFVYSWYYNLPSTYSGSLDTMDGGFDFYSEYPLLYEGTKEALGSYNWLKSVNEQIRYKFTSSLIYSNLEWYFTNHNLWYLEEILGSHIGINPIKPYFCSEILESKFVFNIAKEAGLSGDSSSTVWYGLPALTNEIVSSEWDLDYEYHSDGGNGYVEVLWDSDQTVWFVRIFNSVNAGSSDLQDAVLTLYDQSETVLYTHTLWDTTNDFLIDFDFQELGINLTTVRKLRLETTWWKPLHIREIEVYVGWNVTDWYYTVDSDGIWWKKPYQVYCDMTTDGGGWTKVWENFISFPNFDLWNHPDKFDWYFASWSINNISENTLRSDIIPPSGLDDAFVMRHSWDANSYYELEFTNIPDVEFTSELRVWAWVKWSDRTPFSYQIKYQWSTANDVFMTINSAVIDPNLWRYEEIRIPITDTLEYFKWQIGKWIDASVTPYDVTGVSLELFYN